MKEDKKTLFVTQLDPSLADKLKAGLLEQGFEISNPPYTLFSGKKKGVSCTLYTSGKLVVQGSEIAAFMEFYLEPEILKSFAFSYEEIDMDLTPHIGVDEAGKGDFFGPLCIAGVFAGGDDIKKLKSLGVRDSKGLSDAKVLEIGRKIRAQVAHHIVKINPAKYNELYAQFKNLNHLLAWGHATVIEKLTEQTGCIDVVIDQFADEWVVKRALQKKKITLNLTQRHRAEEDMVVAAASILARQTFLEGLDKLSEEFEMKIPKGASAHVIKAGKQFVRRHGVEALPKVGKMHFKTLDAIVHGDEDSIS